MKTVELKDRLVSVIEGKCAYRITKANEHPINERLARHGMRLLILAKYLETLPDSHPVFAKILDFNDEEDEVFEKLLNDYGSDVEEDPKEFVNAVILKVIKNQQN